MSVGIQKNQNKKVFLIATQEAEKKSVVEAWIKKRFPDSVVFQAFDHPDCVQKFKNAPPQIFITDYLLGKAKPGHMVDSVIADASAKLVPIIIMSPLPEKENYLDEIVTAKVQFLEKEGDEDEFDRCLTKALNFSNQNQSADFKVRFLSPGDILMKEGDPSEQIFIVKKGQLKAYQGSGEKGVERILGNIFPGEFVGEMGYFNGEARMCNVQAVTECELIEVPLGTFEKVLYLRPAWSKKLMETLSKRLKSVTKV